MAGHAVDVAVADYATRTGGSIRATVGHPFWVSAINGTPAPLADPNSPHMARSMTYCRDADGATLTGSCGWVFATDLRPGYALSSTTGTPDVTAVREFRCERTVVYNFRVAETHSYFVATPDGCTAWVHNNNGGKTPEAASGPEGGQPKPPRGPGNTPVFGRDPKRCFTPAERAAKRAEQGNQCAQCGAPIDATNSRGHHITRHADGGSTTPENHAEVCPECHQDLHGEG